MSQITLDEVHSLSLSVADPTNDCSACGAGWAQAMPGIVAPCLPDGEDSHAFIERCDTCQRYQDDNAAAEVFAQRFSLVVHRRYDDEKLEAWRPFVSRPGDDDDHDLFGIGGNEFGCFPDEERELVPPALTI